MLLLVLKIRRGNRNNFGIIFQISAFRNNFSYFCIKTVLMRGHNIHFH